MIIMILGVYYTAGCWLSREYAIGALSRWHFKYRADTF